MHSLSDVEYAYQISTGKRAYVYEYRVLTRIPENVSGGDDDVLRRLMRAFGRAMPFEGGCDAQICLNEGFTLSDFCWNSTVHELCTNGLFSAYWG